ncbi:MAG: hypothetical protein ACP5NS_01170 [Candidatus Pacearchaeota archaeon]
MCGPEGYHGGPGCYIPNMLPSMVARARDPGYTERPVHSGSNESVPYREAA